jgi:hypothetical protein
MAIKERLMLELAYIECKKVRDGNEKNKRYTENIQVQD